MNSNYEPLGKNIRLVDIRNNDCITERVLGISIDKFFMPSVANVIGTDLSKYKLLKQGYFACNPMHVGRDERLPVALYDEQEPGIVSPAYFMFEVIDKEHLLPDYLMMWFMVCGFSIGLPRRQQSLITPGGTARQCVFRQLAFSLSQAGMQPQ